MLTYKRVAVVGSREFRNYAQVERVLREVLGPDDYIISGGAVGVDSMAQRYAKECGHVIVIHYPNYGVYGRGATFVRNKDIVLDADSVYAFYVKGRMGKGGTANTAEWARKLNRELHEYEEET